MKRFAALVVAAALIVGGFVIHNRRIDPEHGRPPLVLWCVPDAAAACERVASGTVVVTVKTPLDMDSEIAGDQSVDAMVTSEAWLQLVANRNRLEISAPLVSTPIVVATRSGEVFCREAQCLGGKTARTAFPERRTIAASVVAAALFNGKAADDIPIAQLEALKRGGPTLPNGDAMLALVNTRLVDAVVTTKPLTASVAGVSVRPVTPAASVGLSIGWIKEDPRLEGLAKKLRTAFTAQGWDGPRENVPGPDSNAVVEAYGILNG